MKTSKSSGITAVSPKIPLPVAAWVVLCAFLNCAGWGLSAIHQLNRTGYAVVMLVGLTVAVAGWRRLETGGCEAFRWRKLSRRFRRPFARAFLFLGLLAILGGALHAPNNYDGLAYRTPRVLNWLAEGRWHWIHTEFQRLNTRTCGFEWVSAPLLAFQHTDRLEFLINAVSFLLLPGLTFSLLRRAGVKSRTAWHWMWILPTAYGYLLQAGSSSNDLFGSVFAVIAVDAALRARQSGRMGEVWLSVLAAVMLTSAKASNLPLLLAWLAAFLAAWRAWLWRPFALGLVILPAVFSSFLPTAVMNQHYGGDWTGARIEAVPIGGGQLGLHFVNNTINYTLQNLVPPIFPWAEKWNRLADRLIPASMARQMADFEYGAAHWKLVEMQIEEVAGLGFGVTTLLLASLVAVAIRRRAAPRPAVLPDWPLRPTLVAPWISLLFTMVKLSLAGGARYLLPYHPLLFTGLLRGEGQKRLTTRKWWRLWAGIGFALAFVLLVVSPARPLWPAQWFLNHFSGRLEDGGLGSRMNVVYRVYADRSEAFSPVLKDLPPNLSLLGIITLDDPETSLWRPFGSRRIVHVLARESGDDIRRRGIRHLLVKESLLPESSTNWLRQVDARVLRTYDLQLRAGSPPSRWDLVELNPPSASQP